MLRDTLTRLAPLLWYLATGTVITTLSQLITNKVLQVTGSAHCALS